MTRSVKPLPASKNALSRTPKLLNHNQLLGQWGETQARDFLVLQGYQFLAQNLRIGKSELDLVMLDLQRLELVVVEVKTRGLGSLAAGHPSLAVRGRKWLALHRVAGKLLRLYGQARGWRLDVVSVSPAGVEHFSNVTWS